MPTPSPEPIQQAAPSPAPVAPARPAAPQTVERPNEPPASFQSTESSPSEDAGAPAEEPDTEGLVDINTASAEALNRLGAGRIGKRIIDHRPYAGPEDLLKKRVLTHKDFDAIKAKITAR